MEQIYVLSSGELSMDWLWLSISPSVRYFLKKIQKRKRLENGFSRQYQYLSLSILQPSVGYSSELKTYPQLWRSSPISPRSPMIHTNGGSSLRDIEISVYYLSQVSSGISFLRSGAMVSVTCFKECLYCSSLQYQLLYFGLSMPLPPQAHNLLSISNSNSMIINGQ